MSKIFKREGSVLLDINSIDNKTYRINTFLKDSEYINYDNSYISLTRINYSSGTTLDFITSGSKPGQSVSGIFFLPNQQVTGVTIPETIIYGNDCTDRGRAVNNFVERSDLYTFQLPTFIISGATKIMTGTTSASTGVYLVDTLSSITFTTIFNDLSGTTNSFFINGNGIKFDLYQKDISSFSIRPLLSTQYYTVSNLMSYLTGYSSTTITYDLSQSEGEFVIKGLYKWRNFTYFSKLSGIEYFETSNSASYTYNIYNLDRDYYFIYLKKALKPTIVSDIISTDTLPLNVISISPSFDGQEQYPLGFSLTSGNGLLVSVNGATLSTNEYLYSANTLYITSGYLYTTDIITIAYSNQANTPPVQTESYKITSIQSKTEPSFGEKVIYNTSSNKYEYWLDYETVNEPILTLNGQQLSNNIDFYVSSSNKKRIIFNGTLVINDIITVFYNSIMNNGSDITTNSFDVSWTIPESTTNTSGYFTLEIADYGDTSFSSPIFTESIPYGINQSTYGVTAYVTNKTYGDKLIARVINYKDYYTILGELIRTISISDIVPFTIKTNSLNNY